MFISVMPAEFHSPWAVSVKSIAMCISYDNTNYVIRIHLA